MPEYLAPGVFVEETSFRSKSIEGVGTSVAALVGPTRTGPLRGVPEVLTSYADFERIFGDAADLAIGEGGTGVLNHSAHAARAFFDNGGKQLFVARVIAGVNAAGPGEDGMWPNAAFAEDAGKTVKFFSRFPGKMGEYTLELRWRDSENLLRTTNPASATGDALFFVEAEGVPLSAKVTGGIADAAFPVNIKAVVKLDGTNLAIQGNRTEIVSMADPANPAPVAATELTALNPAQLPAGTKFTRIFAKAPASGALADGTSAELQLADVTDLSAYTSGVGWGDLRVLRGTLDATGEVFTVTGDTTLNPGVANPITLPLAALAAKPGAARAIIVLRSFDLDVRNGGVKGELIYTYGGLSTAPTGAASLAARLPVAPDRRAEALMSPIACVVADDATGDEIQSALIALCDAAALNPGAASLDEPRYLIALSGAADGTEPLAIDYAGETDEIKGSTGLKALEGVEDVSIVMTPAAAEADEDVHTGVVLEVQKHCRRMRYRVGIVDSRFGQSIGEVRAFAGQFDDSRLAFYHPWVVIPDPTGVRRDIAVPPAGFIAGVYARTDVDRGVHKAPANEIVMGALRFEQQINAFQQELLNPNGINCLRSFVGRGHRVWGGRTLSSDPEWKYVNVRRYFLYLERSIEKSTQWAVFEPNGEALWANIRTSVEDFLFTEWRNGRLLGGTPKEAYFVRCDRSTMTQNDIDNGRMVCLVGVAALKPAEFVIFRIGQKTADA
ncbi:MAG TPA: phage tail sheath subtilisin-like domain-containing protein [Aromatoleum sp.]|uniref:phage tail sheath family protein n=1 Tax=Aromatoleum sp. TaxID=2307007 RepID=UPI002B49DD2A|nr:phage tail sheath subtilisin-like domain-containing protein [Aromatoleum sp.]HJV27964.1 phage tail sheath subtilisin-like domain-containing protein [Aromatoleum sp.]